MNSDLIPLDKLITRLRTDLKLAADYVDKYVTDKYPGPGPAIQRKNRRKASMLFYLEELKRLKEEHLNSKNEH